MLSAAAQETYPYHIDLGKHDQIDEWTVYCLAIVTSFHIHFFYLIFTVDSNDVLYGSDPKYIAELNKMCSVVIEEILNHLKYLGANELYQKQVSFTIH